MASRMECRADDTSPVTVVRLCGPLDLTTTRSVHATPQRCLAAQPEALGEVRRRTASPRVRAYLQPVALACRRARDLAGETCQR